MTYCIHSNQAKYPFELPDLPYSKDAFVPHFSAETFDYHHGKHHNTYVVKLNELIEKNQEYMGHDLESVIHKSFDANQVIYNNAAQIWNHTFFWHSISPNGGGKPTGKMLEKIEKDFGSYEKFAEEFKDAATKQFGSGWAWLVDDSGTLKIMKTSNADNPLSKKVQPLIACDVWEHAYYIDYRNKRPDYVTTFLDHMINWEFAEKHLKKLK